MTPNELACLVWKHHRGMQQKVIARILGLGPPRVARILQAARAKLESALRAAFGDDLDPSTLTESLGHWMVQVDAGQDVPAPQDDEDPRSP